MSVTVRGKQQINEFAGLDDHCVMTAIDLEHRPALGTASRRGILQAELRAQNVGAWYLRRGRGRFCRLTERCYRMGAQARAQPFQISRIRNTQHFKVGWHLVAFTMLCGRSLSALSKLLRIEVKPALPVL